MRTLARVAFVILAMAAFTSTYAASQEKIPKLSGSQIRARIAGMEITDEAHWADVFAANGTLMSYSMSRKKTGKWHVQKDELCIDCGEDDGAATRFGFREKDRTSAGRFQPRRLRVLQKPSARR
jgi:hypothetical protein